jgi:oligoendopeptidase F
MPEVAQKLPHWDLSNVYSGMEADDFTSDMTQVEADIADLEAFVATHNIGRLDAVPADIDSTASVMGLLLTRINELSKLSNTLDAYIYSFLTVDSYNKLATKRQSEMEQLQVRLSKQVTRFKAWAGSLGAVLDQLCEKSDVVASHKGTIVDIVDQSRYLMSTELEDLASELQLSGGGSMWKLQGTVTSQKKMPITRDGKTEEMPMTMIRNLASDESEAVRRHAYEMELKGWAEIKEPVAFSMNCVKGASVTLANWRGRDSVLHGALDRNHIDQETLDALLGTIREYFPHFRNYLKSKATKLGKKKLPWWDLFAPVGKVNPTYNWGEARNFILEQFGTFSSELSDFAGTAFDNNWIDAEPRDGKRGGAFCMRVPKVKESRILANFDGSFDGMITLAHELGHGFHNYCQRDLTPLQGGSPMVLAETASIFCETLVFNAALKKASPEEQLSILENQLLGATQVTVDISSRFLFESEVVKRRANAELSADEFSEIMLETQKETYGDALDENHLHPYMWLLKPHYYYGDLNFYNFPYAFGLLFGLGVYAIYQREGEAFIPRYKELLLSTGSGKAADLAAKYGLDIKSREFWAGSLDVIKKQIDLYCELS